MLTLDTFLSVFLSCFALRKTKQVQLFVAERTTWRPILHLAYTFPGDGITCKLLLVSVRFMLAGVGIAVQDRQDLPQIQIA